MVRLINGGRDPGASKEFVGSTLALNIGEIFEVDGGVANVRFDRVVLTCLVLRQASIGSMTSLRFTLRFKFTYLVEILNVRREAKPRADLAS